MFRLLPAQVLLCLVGAVNGLVASYYATNYVGILAMGAVGLYSPIGSMVSSLSFILIVGSTVLCGRYMGENQLEKMQNVFSLNIALSLLLSFLFIGAYVPASLLDLTGFVTSDDAVRPIFNNYLLGQAIGIIPAMLGNSFASFLSIANRRRRTLMASIVYIATNLALNHVFVRVMGLEAFGLALASSLGLWVFLVIQAQVFLSGTVPFRISVAGVKWGDALGILKIGFPGAAGYIYMTFRGMTVNGLLQTFVGTVGISAFATVDNLLGIVWAIPGGMQNVSLMVMSIGVGEEDRQTLTDVMRVMFRRYVPLMTAFALAIAILAKQLAGIFYADPTEPVFMMTVWGFRIVPFCMPLSVICMHFSGYGQASGQMGLVHLLALLDGFVCVAGFTALLIPLIGMNSAYVANVLNGVVTTLVILAHSVIKNRRLPRNMEELMVIPGDFGVGEDERMDFSVRSVEDVALVSERVLDFCKERGISDRTSFFSALAMEEMAGNVVSHGFEKDRRSHSVDVRVVHKDPEVILRIKDDCVPFDPSERLEIVDPDDFLKNTGIRMVYRMASDVQYQGILGLNVLTIRMEDSRQSTPQG